MQGAANTHFCALPSPSFCLPCSNLVDFCQVPNFSFCFGNHDKKDLIKLPKGTFSSCSSSEAFCGQKWRQIFLAGSKDISSASITRFLNRRKNLDEMGNLPSLNLMKTDKSSLFMQNNTEFSGMVVETFPDFSVNFGNHPTPESSPSLVLLPYGLWSTNLNCSMPLFPNFCLLSSLILWKWNSCLLGTSSVQTCPLNYWWRL